MFLYSISFYGFFSFRIGEWMENHVPTEQHRAARTCFRIKIGIVAGRKAVFFLATWRWIHRWILPMPSRTFVLRGVSLVKMTGYRWF